MGSGQSWGSTWPAPDRLRGACSPRDSWGNGAGRGPLSGLAHGRLVGMPRAQDPPPRLLPLLDLVPLVEAALVLVQRLERLPDDALQLPRGPELLHVLQELDTAEGNWGDRPCHPGLRARAGRPGRRGLGPEGDSCPGAGAAGPCALPQAGGSCMHGSRPQWAARRYRGASHRRAAGLCPRPTGTRPWPTPSPSSGRRNCRPSWPCGHGEPSAGCWAGDGTLPGRCAAPDPKRRLSPVSWWPATLRGYPLPSRDRP